MTFGPCRAGETSAAGTVPNLGDELGRIGMPTFEELPANEAAALTVVVEELAARLFHKPLDEEMLAFIRDVDLEDGGDPICADAQMRAGLAKMQEFCRKYEPGEVLRAASDDFNKLFVGPGHKPCPPWSSVYADGKWLVNGPTAQKVKSVFKAEGFAIPEGNREPWDHISYEFQFMADEQKSLFDRDDNVAGGQATGSGAQSVTKARDFFAKFMSGWIPTFLDGVEREARTEFYKGLAVFTRGVMGVQESVLNRLVPACAA